MKKIAMAVLGLAFCGTSAMATVPSAANCSVSPADDLNGLLLAPSSPSPVPASINLITVRNAANAVIENAAVVVTLTANNVVCGSTILSGVTDAAGEVTLTLGGGGCVDEVPLSGVVKANGVTIRSYENVKSPDNNTGSAGGGDLGIDLTDLLAFAGEFLGPAGLSVCHDYDSSGTTGLGSLIIFGPTFTTPNSCTP